MTEWTIVAVALSLAFTIASMLAWDFGRRTLQERKETRTTDARVDLLEQALSSLAAERKAMAEDWMRKFIMLEKDWQKLKVDAESRYAGAVAQTEANQVRGYHRG